MINEWIVGSSESGSNVMPYPYAFMYALNTVPKPFVSVLPRNVAHYAVLAKSPGAHPFGFAPQFGS